ncbi:hypothetical protein QE152_g22493 [Popillia japonica]|uniref:Uncharacterized protein n=1 Tax=Popillia japonica TaxID=7064 RepID=A0AAW1KLL6_POPJA
MTIRIIQTNLGRGRAAHDLAYATAKQKKVDIIIVSEPNKKIVQSNEWVKDIRVDVAIVQSNEWVKDIRVDVAVLFVNRKLNVSNIKVKEGYIVINFVEWDLYGHITGWQVLDEETLTEHRYISYGITVNKPSERPTEKRKYVTDWDAFNANLELRLANTTKTEKCSYKMCINIIKEAYINSTKEGPRGEKRVPYWWSVEIEAERKECKSMRREYTRMSKKRDKEEEKLLAKKRYNESKKDLRKLIMQSQTNNAVKKRTLEEIMQ